MLLRPSPGAHNDSIGYYIGRLVLELLLVGGKVQAGWMNVLPALNFQPATRDPDGLCGNQRYRRELLVMGIMVPET